MTTTARTPRRVQRIRPRKKGDTGMPPDAKYVGRRSKWGNPYKLGDAQVRYPAVDGREWEHEGRFGKTSGQQHHFKHSDGAVTWHQVEDATPEQILELYRRWLADRTELVDAARRELAGLDLACWCKLPEPGEPDCCHAAHLLHLANDTPASSSPVPARADGNQQ